MDGVIWVFLAFSVALIALGMVADLRRRLLGVDPMSGHCSNCRTPMSPRRVSLIQSLTLRGMWKCPHCGARMRKKAGIAGTATK
jgi:Zn finger protein HypA/HybF involved in hydrogenase expression